MRALKVLALTAGVLLAADRARAELYSWATDPSISTADATDFSLTPGQDILKMWFAQDAAYYYFRLDLRGAPDAVGPNYHSGMYSICVDYQVGGGKHGDNQYIPVSLTGIDYIVDSHFNSKGSGTFDDFHTHSNWTGSGFATIGSPAAHEENGATLEWKINKGDIPAPTFRIWGATHDLGSSAPTYDLAPEFGSPGLEVPEPAGVALLCCGALALLAVWRRRK